MAAHPWSPTRTVCRGRPHRTPRHGSDEYPRSSSSISRTWDSGHSCSRNSRPAFSSSSCCSFKPRSTVSSSRARRSSPAGCQLDRPVLSELRTADPEGTRSGLPSACSQIRSGTVSRPVPSMAEIGLGPWVLTEPSADARGGPLRLAHLHRFTSPSTRERASHGTLVRLPVDRESLPRLPGAFGTCEVGRPLGNSDPHPTFP